MRSPISLAVAVLLLGLPALAQTPTPFEVAPLLETQPVRGAGTSVQGSAVWPHPTTPSASLLLVADSQAGLLAYNLTTGAERGLLVAGSIRGVDVREGVLVDGVVQTLVVVANASVGLEAFVIDPVTFAPRRASLGTLSTGFSPSGVALYRQTDGGTQAFVSNSSGTVTQFQLTAQDGGAVPTPVRSFEVGGALGGMVVDDTQRLLYVSQRDVGLWRYDAEPDSTRARVSVDAVTDTRGLTQPVGGVALYKASGLQGYLLLTHGGTGALRVYDRDAAAQNYRGAFNVVASDGGIDAVDSPRLVTVSNRALGRPFNLGLLAVQDSLNTGGNENFKLVSWSSLAEQFSPQLVVDTSGPPVSGDGGTSDGGGGGGGPVIVIQPPPPDGTGIEGDTSGCGCSSASLPGTVLFVLASGLLLARRRPRA